MKTRMLEMLLPAVFIRLYQDFIDAGEVILAHIPIAGSEFVRLNGLVLHNLTTWDYTLLGNKIIFGVDALLTVGDTFSIKYQYTP